MCPERQIKGLFAPKMYTLAYLINVCRARIYLGFFSVRDALIRYRTFIYFQDLSFLDVYKVPGHLSIFWKMFGQNGQNRPNQPPKCHSVLYMSFPDIYNVLGRLFFLEICPSWTSLLRIGLLLILMYCPSRTFISGRTLIRYTRVLMFLYE